MVRSIILTILVLLSPVGLSESDMCADKFNPSNLEKSLRDFVANIKYDEFIKTQNEASLSCADTLINPAEMAKVFKEEIASILSGLGIALAERSLACILKQEDPPYPNICHVMSKKNFDINASFTKTGEECKVPEIRDPISGKKRCPVPIEVQSPTFEYYWPKYFIEVSKKTNDSLDAFSDGNKMYQLNRLFAELVRGGLDLGGPQKMAILLQKGGGEVAKQLSSFFGKTGDPESDADIVAMISKTAIFNKLSEIGIRNRSGNQLVGSTTYEPNIWPVGLSKVFFDQVSICGRSELMQEKHPANARMPEMLSHGGPPGIPGITLCPLAVANDAWPYWTTGILDYLNPKSYAAMGSATATGPMCAADFIKDDISFSSPESSEINPKSEEPKNAHLGTETEKSESGESYNDKLKGFLSKVPEVMQNLRFCSYPILGDFEAVGRTYMNLAKEATDGFKGPYCTAWGPVVPKMATQLQATEYSFANKALQFHLFANEVFGVMRGSEELWSQVYPWPLDKSVSINALVQKLIGFLESNLKFKIPESVKSRYANDSSTGDKVSGLKMYKAGDPRLMDTDMSYENLMIQISNFIRQAVYLGAIHGSSEATRMLAENLINEIGKAIPSINKKAKNEFPENFVDYPQVMIPNGSNNDENINSNDANKKYDKEISETEDSAVGDIYEIPIFEPVQVEYFCTITVDKHGYDPLIFGHPKKENFTDFAINLLQCKNTDGTQIRNCNNPQSIEQLSQATHKVGYFSNPNIPKYFVKADYDSRFNRQANKPCYNENIVDPKLAKRSIDRWGQAQVLFMMYARQKIQGYRKVNKKQNWKRVQHCYYTGQLGTKTDSSDSLRGPFEKDHGIFCAEKIEWDSPQENEDVKVDRPDPNDPAGTLRDKRDRSDDSELGKSVNDEFTTLKDAGGMAAKIATFIGAEIARAKYESMTGKTILPEEKRVYLLWEKIKCRYPDYKRLSMGSGATNLKFWKQCREGVRIAIRRYIHENFIPALCGLFQDELGDPFK